MRLGYRIDLGEPVFPRLPRKTRNTIKRSTKTLTVRRGSLEELTKLHWDTVYLPTKLGEDQMVFVATYEGLPVSAILLEDKGDHLLYKYAGNDRDYINHNGNTLLLFWVAEHYRDKYSYIDLGGSAKPSIDDFKRRLSTSSYELKPKTTTTRLLAKIWYHCKRLTR